MTNIDEDFMRDEYTMENVCDIQKNPYAKKMTTKEKFVLFVNAFIAENNWTKEEAKKEMDLMFH